MSEAEISRIMAARGVSTFSLAIEDGCIEIIFMSNGQQYEASMDPLSGEILAIFLSAEHRL